MKREIEEKRLEELEDIELKMRALESGGLDNWEGYDISLESYFKEKEQKERMMNVIDEVIEALCEGVEEPAGRGCGFGVRPECISNASDILSKFIN
jgi:hypothetical protein